MLFSLLAGTLPVLALGAPSVTVAAGNNVISQVGADYTLRVTVDQELRGGGVTFTLPDITDAIVITGGATADSGVLTVTGGTNVTLLGGATYNAGTGAWTTPAGAGTITVAATAVNQTGTWTNTTASATIGVSVEFDDDITGTGAPGVFTLPDVGDTIQFSDSGVGNESVTLTGLVGNLTVIMSGTGTWTPAAGGGVIVFDATGTETADVSSDAPELAGNWAQTVGAPTAAVLTEVDEDITLGNTAGDVITLTFPSDTAINVAGIAATISAESGWIGGAPNSPAVLAGVAWGGSATSRTITATLRGADAIGEGAEVRIVITGGITNPTTPGDYTLTVKTSQEPTAQTSNVYTIVPPSLYYPGTVELWNPGGYLMNVGTNINAALALCTSPGYTIKLGSGYYDEAIVIGAGGAGLGVTIEAMEGATPIIADLPADAGPVSGTLTILAAADKTAAVPGVVLDGLTFMGDSGAAGVLTIGAEGVTVQNCSFTKAGSSTTTPSQTMIAFTAASPNYPSTITGCDFDLGLGSINDIGVNVTGNNLTISDCTFAGDGAGAPFYTQDYYIQNSGGTALMPTRSTGNTGTGTFGGTLIYTPPASVGVMRSTNDTMSGLWRALRVYGGSLTVSGASISGCGVPATSAPPLGVPAVDIAGAATVFTMTNSSVSGSYAYAFSLGTSTPAAAVTLGNVNVMFNKITSNAKNVYSLSPAAIPGNNFTHNWWGASTGPASGSLGYLTGPTTERIDTRFPLGAPGTGDIALLTATYTGTVTGVTVGIQTSTLGFWFSPSGLPSPAAQIGSALYESNPAPLEPPYPVLDDGYLDIFVGTPGAVLGLGAGPTDIATITIPNADINANTVVMIWNPLTGEWGMADQQGVNALSGTVWFIAGPDLWPEITDLGGTAVALVTAPEPPLSMPTGLSPALGAYDVEIDPSFTWNAVAGADSYEFQIAEQTNVPGVDPYAIPFDVKIVEINGCRLIDSLKYETTYVWRVKAIKGSDESAWVNSFLTTMAEPAEPTPPVEIIQQEPTVINLPDWPDTIVQEQTPVIPDYLLWVVVGVGAVLVIAVIVLIVRTRRVA